MRQASQHELTLRFSPLDNCLPTFRSDAAPSFNSSRPILFPEFDYSGRKFTPSDAGASAGFRPHLKQEVVFAEQFALGNLVSFNTLRSLGGHFQEFDECSDILFVGVHDNPPRN